MGRARATTGQPATTRAAPAAARRTAAAVATRTATAASGPTTRRADCKGRRASTARRPARRARAERAPRSLGPRAEARPGPRVGARRVRRAAGSGGGNCNALSCLTGCCQGGHLHETERPRPAGTLVTPARTARRPGRRAISGIVPGESAQTPVTEGRPRRVGGSPRRDRVVAGPAISRWPRRRDRVGPQWAFVYAFAARARGEATLLAAISWLSRRAAVYNVMMASCVASVRSLGTLMGIALALSTASCTSLLGDFTSGESPDASMMDGPGAGAGAATARRRATEAGDGLGKSCASNAQCNAGQTCTDGVCCESACDGVCEACNQANAAGHCNPIPAMTDPDKECVADAPAGRGDRDGQRRGRRRGRRRARTRRP